MNIRVIARGEYLSKVLCPDGLFAGNHHECVREVNDVSEENKSRRYIHMFLSCWFALSMSPFYLIFARI